MRFSRIMLCLVLGVFSSIVVFSNDVLAEDSRYLYGIHWWGYTEGQPVDDAPASLLDVPACSAWDVETVLTNSGWWWAAGYFTGLYQELYNNKNMTIITRVDYTWGDTVPAPSDPNYSAWPAKVVSEAVNVLYNQSHIWVVGNEQNLLMGTGSQWPNRKIPPAEMAAIYKNVRSAIHNSALVGAPGEHVVLLAPVSPGGVGGERWMSGTEYLSQMLDYLTPGEVDGFAIHSYGGSVADFHNVYASQIAIIDSKGFSNKPIYMTEWNRYAAPGNSGEEAQTAQFLRDAFADVNNWNQTAGNHDIICMTWFVYDNNQQAASAWDGYALEYWKDNGNPYGNSGDLYTAFEQTVDLRYPAGEISAGPPGQNDAGTGSDAGNDFAAATFISPGNYSGWLDKGIDPNDYYAFNVSAGQDITISMTPPPYYDYDLYLYDPTAVLKASAALDGNVVENIIYTADMAGQWRIRINVYSAAGTGTYTFSLGISGLTGQNLALDAVTYVECGHNEPGQYGLAAKDGNLSTKWCCLHNGFWTSGDHTLRFDLGTTCTLTGYIIKHSSTGGEPTIFNTEKFYIESAPSLQGPWTQEFYVVNTNQESQNTLIYDTPKNLQYIRIRITDPNYAGDWAVRIPEIEIWGYKGIKGAIKFEAEDYDAGANAAQGTDYFDITSGNSGGQYRKEDVDIETCSESGYNVGWISAGEWLKFRLDTSGKYQIYIRYAAVSNGQCHIEIDGIDVTGIITLPATGAWQTWAWKSAGDIELTAGDHIVKLIMDSSGFNINYFSFERNLALDAATYIECGHNDENQRGLYCKDGDVSTKWCCLHNSISTHGDHILTYDLGSDTKVTGYVVKHASTSGEPTYFNTKEFYIESAPSLQGPWSEEFHINNNSDIPVNTERYSSPKTLRYVRIRAVVPNFIGDWAVRIPEFEVYGYPGAKAVIKFEAEDYDSGHVAAAERDYHDTDAVNSGGQYRNQGVDIEVCSEGGYNVGWIYAGEWLNYQLRASEGGRYTIRIRYAGISDGQCHIEIDGVNVTGRINLPATGGWQIWGWADGPTVNISSGDHSVRLVVDVSGFNVNYFTFAPAN
ncbi:MAG: carbohydrate-binding protein [Candidatus Omnitrophota bacterium]